MTLEQIANALARYQTASVNLDDSRKAQDEMYAANDCAVAWEAVRILLPIAQAAVALEAGIQGNDYGELVADTGLLEDVVNAVKALKGDEK